MKVAFPLTVLAASGTVSAQGTLHEISNYAVKESHPVSPNWEIIGDAPANHIINLKIGLKQSNFPELERHLYEVSDPYHERYGQHLSSAEVDELVRPHSTTNHLVHDWLNDFGIEPHRLSYSSAGDWILVALPVADVSVCDFSAVTPECLRTIYGTMNYIPKAPDKNRIAVNNFLNQTNNRSDVALFLDKYRPEAVQAAHQFKTNIIADGANQQTPLSTAELGVGLDLEGNLDVETVLAIAYPTPLETYNTGGMPPFNPDQQTRNDTNEPYLTWINYLSGLSDSDLPQLVSTSYGDDEQTVPFSYANRVCQQYARLGARGVSLLFGSGDLGVGADGTCHSNDGKNTPRFLASFSSSCPYVTSVSGTKNYPEVVAHDEHNGYVGGGGFSNYFARPSYQDAAVTNYLKEIGTLYDGLYNSSGRGYPDIVAQSQSFVVAWNGTFVHLDGTSCATPTAAAVLALVNDALIAAGKPVLGFLNPWLYSKGHTAFTDVTEGSNLGCSTDGFPAKKGWDAASGFGSPNFPKILKSLGLEM